MTLLATQGYTVYATHIPAKVPAPVPGVTWLSCDLIRADATATWPTQCDSVIYLAQSPAWRVFPVGAVDVFQVNVAAALRAAEYARQARVRRFIFASSGSVYTQIMRPACEAEPFDLHAPRTFYVASKLAAELLLRPYATLLPVVILRLFTPYGVGQNPDMLIPQLVRRVREGEPISLHGTDGLRTNPVAVGDVVDVLRACLALDTSVILNIAGPEVLTLREIGLCIGRVLGLEPRFETHPDQVPPVIVGDTSALRAALGWVPETRFEAGLRNWLQDD